MLCHGPEMSNVSAIRRAFRSQLAVQHTTNRLAHFLSSGDHLVDDVDGETREQVDCSVDWREWPTVGTWPPLNRPVRTSRKYTSTDVRRTNNPCVIEETRQSLERGMRVHRVGFCWMLAVGSCCYVLLRGSHVIVRALCEKQAATRSTPLARGSVYKCEA
jgi:hypothetical protein